MPHNQSPDRNHQGQKQNQTDTSRQRKDGSDKQRQDGNRQPSRNF